MTVDLKKLKRAIEESVKKDESTLKDFAAAVEKIKKFDAALDKMSADLKAQKKDLGELE